MKIEGVKVRYRRADMVNIAALVDHRVRFLKELGARKGRRPREDQTRILKEKLLEYFSKAIPSRDFIALLAEYDGNIVGTGALVAWQRPPKYGALISGRAGYIFNLYTVPEARRKGICTQLLSNLIEEAKALGLKYLHLRASEDGIRIYRRAGFAEPEDLELQLKLE